MANNFIGTIVKCKHSAYAKDYEKYFKVKTIIHYTDTKSHRISFKHTVS